MGIHYRLKYLQEVRQATSKAYFSGNYRKYGINVQAGYDNEFRFVYAEFSAPGGANDISELRKTQFIQIFQKLSLNLSMLTII